jgi:hypothetical protein
MIASSLFEVLVALFTIALLVFFVWWMRDVYRTSLAREAAHDRIEKIGVTTTQNMTPGEISKKLRYALLQNRSNNQDVFFLLASLFILRRDLGLRCKFFADELAELPPSILEELVKSDELHIRPEDVLRLRHADATGIAEPTVERLEENIQELRNNWRVQRLFAARAGNKAI